MSLLEWGKNAGRLRVGKGLTVHKNRNLIHNMSGEILPVKEVEKKWGLNKLRREAATNHKWMNVTGCSTKKDS